MHPIGRMAVRTALQVNKLPMDIIDPDHRKFWGVHRLRLDFELMALESKTARMDAGDMTGLSLKDKVAHEYRTLDESSYNEVEDFRRKLREPTR